MITSLALWVALAAAGPDKDMDVEASLSGYNLLWPSQRCCAFKLHIQADGQATVSADISTDQRPRHFTQELTLTADQLVKIRKAIDDVQFFDLPSICCGPVDGDERSIQVTVGHRKHRVSFPEQMELDASVERKRQFERLMSLWVLVTSSFHIPSATVK